MSEKMSPQKLEAVLGKFFDEMSTIILGNEVHKKKKEK
jgi:hypothetical protein